MGEKNIVWNDYISQNERFADFFNGVVFGGEEVNLPHSEYLSGFAAADRLIPVVTVGVYLGEQPWTGFTRLGDMAGAGEVPPEIREPMLRASNDFQVNLFTVHAMETSGIFQTDLREVFGFLKLLPDKNKLKHYVEENEGFQHLREDAYDVLSLYSGNRKLEYKKESYRLKEGNGMSMCTAMREWAEEERREGRQEGRYEGRYEGRHAGVAAVNELIRCLFTEGKTEELFRSSQDLEYQKKLMEEYGILCEWEQNRENNTNGERNEEKRKPSQKHIRHVVMNSGGVQTISQKDCGGRNFHMQRIWQIVLSVSS